MKFSIKDFFRKYGQIRRKLQEWKTSFFVQCKAVFVVGGAVCFYVNDDHVRQDAHYIN